MKRAVTLLLIFTMLLLPASPVLAWSAPGHMVIAAEAYRALTPELQRKVTEILKAHPDYEKWKAAFQDGTPGLDLPLYVFMRASTWPDEIRRKGNPYDHAQWHYIDYPLRPPLFRMEEAPAPQNDVLFGISQRAKVLSDTNAPAKERAAYLSWLIHLVGDLHQPLHCESLFTAEYPTGDKGGNDFWVRPNTAGVKLHSIWDQALGRSVNARAQLNDTIRIEAEHPKKTLSELTKDTTPKAWSLEGRSLAIEKGYLRGELKGGTTKETAQDLPADYTKQLKLAAEKQAALAGYRLAEEIRKLVR